MQNGPTTSFSKADIQYAALTEEELSIENIQAAACTWHPMSIQKTRPIWTNSYQMFHQYCAAFNFARDSKKVQHSTILKPFGALTGRRF